MISEWVRETFDLDIDWHADEVSEDYDEIEVLLLGLEGDTIDDETFLRISHEMESHHYVVDRLLKLGRLVEGSAGYSRQRYEAFLAALEQVARP